MVTWGAPSRGGLALLAASLALTQAAIFPRQSSEAPRAWVTVEADGATKTITPTVNDGKTTSVFPGNTALPTAEAQGGGAFVLCNSAAGSGGLAQPFCAPAKDNQVEGGKTYFGEQQQLQLQHQLQQQQPCPPMHRLQLVGRPLIVYQSPGTPPSSPPPTPSSRSRATTA